jgi:hypothetical protein
MATSISLVGRVQYSDENGTPYAGGKIYTYEAGTTTPKDTYSDYDGLVPHANPIILDSAGRATIRLGEGAYKFVVTNAADAAVWTQDNILSISGLISGTAGTYAMFADGGTGLADSETVQNSDGNVGVGGDPLSQTKLAVHGKTYINGVLELEASDWPTPLNRCPVVEWSTEDNAMRIGGGSAGIYPNTTYGAYAIGSTPPIHINGAVYTITMRNLAFTNGAEELGNYADDAAAAIGGVPVGTVYRNGSVLRVRVS